jgi:hypothetical protein
VCFEDPITQEMVMSALNQAQRQALAQWYRQDWLLERVTQLIEARDWVELEDYVQRDALMPSARLDTLPAFMKNEASETLFPDGLNPMSNLDGWQDAVEVGWDVLKAECGVSQDDVHKAIAKLQQQDWDDFLRRAEARKVQDDGG